MSGGMYGADVAQLRELARQLQAASDRLDGSRRRIGTDIRIAAWIGPVAVRFRMQWDNDYSRRVQAASDALEGMATAIIRNAEEQERASARGGGSISDGGRVPGDLLPHPVPFPFPPNGRFPGFPEMFLPWPGGRPLLPPPTWFRDLGELWQHRTPTPKSWKALTDHLEAVLGTSAAALTMVTWITTLQDTGLLKTSFLKAPIVEKVTGPLGLAMSAISTAEAIREGDVVGAWLNGGSGVLDAGLATAGTAAKTALAPAAGTAAATGLAAIGLGVSALVGLIEFGLPYNAEKQDAAMAAGVAQVFPGADPANLTAQQQDYMTRRYQGWGVAHMISDQMVASGEPIRKAIGDSAQIISTLPVLKGIAHVFRR